MPRLFPRAFHRMDKKDWYYLTTIGVIHLPATPRSARSRALSCRRQRRNPPDRKEKRYKIMMNMQNKKTRRVITGVIIAVLIITMVLPMVLSYLM